jgi:hypothetical protein
LANPDRAPCAFLLASSGPVNRAEPALTATLHPKSPIVWVPAHAADTRPHAFRDPELLFPSHNAYLNDVKHRATSGVTKRNGEIQDCVKRQRGETLIRGNSRSSKRLRPCRGRTSSLPPNPRTEAKGR